MVYTCFSCKWRGDKYPRRSFHQFPSNAELKQKWLDILGKSNVSIGKRTSLCSLHFEENCFRYGSVMGKKLLKDGCFPTLHLPKTVTKDADVDSVDEKIFSKTLMATTEDVKIEKVTSKLDNEDNVVEGPKPTTNDVDMKDSMLNIDENPIEGPQPTTDDVEMKDPMLNIDESPIEGPPPTTDGVEMKDPMSESNIDDNPIEGPQPTTDGRQMKDLISRSNIQNDLVKGPLPTDSVQLIITTSKANIQNNLIKGSHAADTVQMIITTSRSNIQNNLRKSPMKFCSHKGLNGISGPHVIQHWKGQISCLKAQMSELKRTVKKLRNSKIKLKTQVRDLKKVVHKYEAEGKVKQLKFDPIPKALFELLQVPKKRVQTYPQPLREFAWTVSHLSPKTYTYVRKVFPVLPHEGTLRKWTLTVKLKPGICEPSMNILERKSIEAKMAGKRLLCNVTVADMAVREPGKTSKSLKSKSVMVVMAVCLNDNWKLPVAYHFINGLNIDDRTNIIKECFERIHNTGVSAVALTFDGSPTNIAIARKLGADMVHSNFQQSFPHPVTKDPVHVVLDASHAIKLVRNTTRLLKKLSDGYGNLIDWDYFKKLVAIQNEYELQEGTKIRQRHLQIFKQSNYYQKKIHEKLAAQLLNQSVSSALEYFRSQSIDFEGSFGTEQFCLIMHDVFDLMNSHETSLQITNRECINKDNFEEITGRVAEYENYIKEIRTPKMKIIESKRRLGFYSLIVSMRSALNVFERYGMGECPSLENLSTYKLCQGHLEMFYLDVRAGPGHSNNPTIKQFESTLKSLLIDQDVMITNFGKGLKQENFCLLKSCPKNDATSLVDSSV